LLLPDDNLLLMVLTAPDPGSLRTLHRLDLADAN
jgi:hypothetical protein